jgi:transposase
MARPTGFSREQKERAVRLVAEGIEQHGSEYAAMASVAGKLGTSTETVRRWVRQAQVDGGGRPGVTSDAATELARLRRENAELRRANEILKSASAFFAAELDRPGPR